MKNSAALAQIRQLSCLGLPGREVLPALLRSVRELVASDSAGFFWVDASGDIADMYAERSLPAAMTKMYFERFYDSPQHSFREGLAQRVRDGIIVEATTPDPEFQRSPYYNEILRNLDAHHVLYGVVRDRAGAIGQISLYRDKQAPAFGTRERRALESVIRYVAHALDVPDTLRPTDSGPAVFQDADEEALLVCTYAGEIVQASDQARLLMKRAVNVPVNPGTVHAGQVSEVRQILADLGRCLRGATEGRSREPPRRVCESPWGRFLLRAYAFDGGDMASATMGVLIRRQENRLLRLADAMLGLPLSPQQREVAMHLARGCSNSQIAAEMRISINTANYHIKQMFLRLDVHDREQAIERILESQASR